MLLLLLSSVSLMYTAFGVVTHFFKSVTSNKKYKNKTPITLVVSTKTHGHTDFSKVLPKTRIS